MSTTRYFTHVDKFCDGTAYIEVGDFGTRIVSASGAREDSTWTLDECMGNCLEGAWRELSEADVIVLNIPSAPVDPRDATIATLQRELEALRKKLSAEEEDHAQLQARCYEGFPSASDGIFDELSALRAELERKDAALKEARDWRGDLTVLYEKRDAICRDMKDCKHCAKWAGHPISTMCCESGTPNHYGQLSNIDKEIQRQEDRCIVPHEVRAIIERALQPKEPPCQKA